MGNLGMYLAHSPDILTSMEDTMKKLLVLICLIALWAGLGAAWNLATFNLEDLNLAPNALTDYVRSVSKAGQKIYHYNDQYILASQNANDPAWRSIPEPQPGEKLYLLSKIKASAPSELQKSARILVDLGNELLISSRLDLPILRSSLKGSFMALSEQGIRIPPAEPELIYNSEDRTEIQQLISQVSADSVMAFIQSMQDLQTRYALADNRLEVAYWIKAQFERFGITNVELQPFEWNLSTQYNVVATIPGTMYPNEYLVVGGHHDSITYTTPYELAPGADDNASGSVAAIEMARVMMAANYQPRCSIRFVTFAAEEFGLWGSQYNANISAATGENIRLMINHDMIANNNPGNHSVQLMPYEGALPHSQHAATLTQEYTNLDVVYGYLNSSSSDSYSYWVNGYPVVYYFETDFSPYYHSDQDLTTYIDPVYAAEVIRASTAVAVSFADMPGAPQNVSAWDVGDGSSLYISWDEINDPAVDFFRVYYSSDSWNTWQTQESSINNCTITGLNAGTYYDVAIATVDNDGNESYLVYCSGTPWANPLTPVNLTETPDLNQVQLQWDANTELDHYGYWVYRSTDPGQLGDKIHPGTLNDNYFTDHNAAGLADVYYYYRVVALDQDQNQSEPTAAISSRPVTLDQGVLIVDESLDYAGSNPFQPTDAMVDEFYNRVLDNFNTQNLDLLALGELPRLADIGVFGSILWHGTDTSDMTIPYFVRDQLAKYLELGGNILFTGYQPSLAFDLNASYPSSFDEDNYLNSVLGISGVDYSIQGRFKYAMPQIENFPALQVDSLKTSSAFNGHIIRVEALQTAPGASTVYTYGSDYADDSTQGQLNDGVVAIFNEYGAGRIFSLSFPLYHMQEPGTRALLNHVFRYYFSESSPNHDEVVTPAALGLRSYPNPFNSHSSFVVQGLDPKQAMKVEIFNLKGQRIRTLHDAEAKTELSWDAKDDSGRTVASGIYFVKLSQGNRTITKKMARM